MMEALFALLLFAGSLLSLTGLQAQIMEQGEQISIRSDVELALHQLASTLPTYHNQDEYPTLLFDHHQAQEFSAKCITNGRFDAGCDCRTYSQIWRHCGETSCTTQQALKYFLLRARCDLLAIHPVSNLVIQCLPAGKQPCTQSDRLILTVAWQTVSSASANSSREPARDHFSERCSDLLDNIEQIIEPAAGSMVQTLSHCVEIMS